MSAEARREAVLAVREGWRLHYASDEHGDADLDLLVGDRRYAEGLERLARAGDVEAIAALADLISACARAAAEGRPEDAGAAWGAATRHLAPGLALDH